MLKGTVPKAFRQRKGHCARFLLAPNSIKQVKERGKHESNAKKNQNMPPFIAWAGGGFE
jgi:hypothetical protein